MSEAGIELHLDARDLAKLYKDLKTLGDNSTVILRRGVKDGSSPIVDGIKARASFSHRIPASIKPKPSFSASNPSVTIIADAKVAPEAAPLNNRGQSGTFRHPVFGNRDNWVDQAAHPFMTPTSAEIAAAEKAILAAMDAAARKAGFS